MKKMALLVAMGVLAGISGCIIPPFEEPRFVEIGTSETAFMIPLNKDTKKQEAFDSESLSKENMVAMKRVRIPREWIQTGRKWLFGLGPYTGYFQPQVRVVKVNRAPVTVVLEPESQNGIWVESKDSVDFSTGISITARIKDDDDAITFLYNYPPRIMPEGQQGQEASVDERATEVQVGSLEATLKTEVRARVQKVFAEQAAAEDLDTLRDKKKEIMKAVEDDIVPFFAERGFEITTVGQKGGFAYKNPNIQAAIDKVFEAQQDKEVALAEAAAATERKEALKLKGEGAAAEKLAQAEGEAEAIKAVADARAYETEQLLANQEFYIQIKRIEVMQDWLERWDGTLPRMMMGDTGSGLLLEVPMPEDVSRSKADSGLPVASDKDIGSEN